MLRELQIHQNPGLQWPLQLSPLKATDTLQSLRLAPGPIVSIPHWRLHVVHMLPQLLQLDDEPVTAEEQVGNEHHKYHPEASGIPPNAGRKVLHHRLQIHEVVAVVSQLAATEGFGGLVYIQRRIWESLIRDESFTDRRLLRLNECEYTKHCPSS